MRISFWKLIPAGLLLLAMPGFAAMHPKHHLSKSHHASVKQVSERHRRGWHLHVRHEVKAPAEMPTERATQIQTALIKRGYLNGEPTGRWDEQTIAAMQKLQGDNGWQTKITPDSRALIKLGLGPKDAGPGAAAESASATSPASGAAQTASVAQTRQQ